MHCTRFLKTVVRSLQTNEQGSYKNCIFLWGSRFALLPWNYELVSNSYQVTCLFPVANTDGTNIKSDGVYINNSLHLARKYARIFVRGHYLFLEAHSFPRARSSQFSSSEKRTVFRERSSRKTVSFEEQIMSKDKYQCIFLKTNGDYCVYYPSNIFRTVARAGSANLSTNTLNWDEIITFCNDITPCITFVTFLTQELLSHCKTRRNCAEISQQLQLFMLTIKRNVYE